MDNEELAQSWIESSAEDFELAQDLFNIGRYTHCLYFGHLGVEKLFKALFAKLYPENPYAPKIHNLIVLAEKCNIELDDEMYEKLKTINTFNMEARYDVVKKNFYTLCTKEYTATQFAIIEGVTEWLKEKLINQ